MTTFYVKDINGNLVQATNLILPGQALRVPDPNGGVFMPTSASDPTLTTPTIVFGAIVPNKDAAR
jgi:hypothetical protein